MMPMLETDILINGGGMVGMTLALLLAKSGFKVIVIEQGAIPQQTLSADAPVDNRVFALTHASQIIFRELGIDLFEPSVRRGVMQRIQVWDQVLTGKVQFDALEANVSQLGIILEQQTILSLLTACCWQYPEIRMLQPDRLVEIQQKDADGLTVRTQQHQIRTKLLIGCDGANSWVRKASGISLKTKSYEQIAIVATIVSEQLHCNTAFQCFNPTGALALLPLHASNVLSIVWSAATDRGLDYLALSTQAFGEKLTQESDAVLGQLSLLSQPQYFPLREQHAITYVTHRIALVGDAAHVIHPLAGQGVNLGLLDAYELATVLKAAKLKHRDIGTEFVLKRYARKRQLRNQGMIYLMRAFKEGFGAVTPIVQLIRNQGLDWVDQSHFLKQFFIHQALGKL